MTLVLALTLLFVATQADEWAILVAGSNSWSNYRHQSDVCHAYQVVSKNGVPDSRIIVMQYNDLASNAANPYPGQIFNAPSPTGIPGVNVYANCKKDYIGDNVTAAHFLAVLTGDSKNTSGPVLQSQSTDHVFVYFTDHGGTGLVAFPTGPYLTVTELNTALQTMVEKKMFGQLTFYMEACEAGSMFADVLPKNENIYVTTAANSTESSWATYCPPQDFVNGTHMNTCLGDLYSINWLQNSDQPAAMKETLERQYTIIKQETTESNVMQYGDLNWVNENIGQFFADSSPRTSKIIEELSRNHNIHRYSPNYYHQYHRDQQILKSGTIRSRDVSMHLSYYKYLRAYNQPLEKRMALLTKLQEQLNARVKADMTFFNLAKEFGGEELFYSTSPSSSFTTPLCGKCCDYVYETYRTRCGGFDDYSLQYARVISNICHTGKNADTIAAVLTKHC